MILILAEKLNWGELREHDTNWNFTAWMKQEICVALTALVHFPLSWSTSSNARRMASPAGLASNQHKTTLPHQQP